MGLWSPIVILASALQVAIACDEGKIMPDADCGSYMGCIHGQWVKQSCPNGLHFNKELGACDWPASAKCSKEFMPESSNATMMPSGPPPPHGPGPRFAPYFDVMIDGPKLSQIYEKTGQKDFTLAFVLGSSKGCDPKWGAEKDLDDPMIIGEIRKVQAHGGQMIVALGGAVGPYLEHLCNSVDSLAEAYKKILDVVKTNHLDVDVEATINNDLVNKALAKVQKERPGTTVSYTLMVQGEDYGVTPQLGVAVLESARDNGVELEIVNPMVMEFGGPSPDYGDQIIGAIKSTLRQMKAIWPSKTDGQLRRMLGATPMLGKNFNQKVFETKHARRLVEWANNNHIGFLGFWSIGRDNGGCSGQISPSCSGTSQSEYEFTKIFQDFKA